MRIIFSMQLLNLYPFYASAFMRLLSHNKEAINVRSPAKVRQPLALPSFHLRCCCYLDDSLDGPSKGHSLASRRERNVVVSHTPCHSSPDVSVTSAAQSAPFPSPHMEAGDENRCQNVRRKKERNLTSIYKHDFDQVNGGK